MIVTNLGDNHGVTDGESNNFCIIQNIPISTQNCKITRNYERHCIDLYNIVVILGQNYHKKWPVQKICVMSMIKCLKGISKRESHSANTRSAGEHRLNHRKY